MSRRVRTSLSVIGAAMRGTGPSVSVPRVNIAWRVWPEPRQRASRGSSTCRLRAANLRRMRAFWAGLLVVAALATVVRVVDLRDLPPGLFCDEAGNGYNSYLLLTTGKDENRERFPLYIWSFGVVYKNPVFIYAATLPIAALGLSEFSVRLTAAGFGVLAVLAIGVLGRLAMGPVGGLIAALL